MKALRLTLVSILLAVPAAVFAGSNLIYGPWVHNVSEHGFTVIWVTEKPSLDYVEVAPDDGSAFEAKERPKYYQTAFGRRSAGRYHSVRIEGLDPGTSYRYRVVGQVVTDDSSAYRLTYGPKLLISQKKNPSVRTLDSSAGTCRFSMVNDIPLDGAVIVSTPQAVALADVEKGINMFRNPKIDKHIYGIIENMAWFTPAELPENRYYIFGKDGSKAIAAKYGIEILAQIPLVQSICEKGDEGAPEALDPNSVISKALDNIVF